MDEAVRQDTEHWRIVAEAPSYAVSSHGRVKRVVPDKLNRPMRMLRTPLSDKGYPCCTLHVDGKQLHREVHRLVCVAFVGPKPSLVHEVRHLDGNKKNAAASNLQWGTSAENKADCLRHGTRPRGESFYAAKLTEGQVKEIRAKPRGRKYYAERFGVSPWTISDVIQGKTWAHVRA